MIKKIFMMLCFSFNTWCMNMPDTFEENNVIGRYTDSLTEVKSGLLRNGLFYEYPTITIPQDPVDESDVMMSCLQKRGYKKVKCIGLDFSHVNVDHASKMINAIKCIPDPDPNEPETAILLIGASELCALNDWRCLCMCSQHAMSNIEKKTGIKVDSLQWAMLTKCMQIQKEEIELLKEDKKRDAKRMQELKQKIVLCELQLKEPRALLKVKDIKIESLERKIAAQENMCAPIIIQRNLLLTAIASFGLWSFLCYWAKRPFTFQ